MSTARLWFYRNIVGNRFASRSIWRRAARALQAQADGVVFWFCILMTALGYAIGWPV
jgi:hypothetical protein